MARPARPQPDDEDDRKKREDHERWLIIKREQEVKRLLQIEAELLRKKQAEAEAKTTEDRRFKVKSVKRSFKKPRFVCEGPYQDWTNTFSRSTVHWDKHQEILDMDKDRVATPLRQTDLCCGNSPSRSPHRQYSVIHRSKCGEGMRALPKNPGKKAVTRPAEKRSPNVAYTIGKTPSTAYKTPKKSATKSYRPMSERKVQSAARVRQNLFATPQEYRGNAGQIYDIRTHDDSVNLTKGDLYQLAQNLTVSLADPKLKKELLNASVEHEGKQMSLQEFLAEGGNPQSFKQ